MSPNDLIVRCMARREGDMWVAVCLDFSLAAQGGSLSEARQKLHKQIFCYVKDAYTVDAKHAVELLSRKAPLADRLMFAWCQFRSRMRPALRKLVYREALPLKPAFA